MITEINRQTGPFAYSSESNPRTSDSPSYSSSISMKFRRSTRHTELIRRPYRSTCHSVSRRFTLLLLNLQITFPPRSFVLLSIFLLPWMSERILTSLSNIKSRALSLPESALLEKRRHFQRSSSRGERDIYTTRLFPAAAARA